MTPDDLSCGGESLRLVDLSPRDIKWEDLKPQAMKTADAYAGTVYDKYSERISGCSGWLQFALVPNDDGEVIHKLQAARLCHCRHCPTCAWRTALMWRARTFRGLRRIIADYPGKRFIFLTLTVRTCEVDQLGATLTWMSQAWQRLSQTKDFPALGWLRRTEVERSHDGKAHPHFHVLMMVNPSYFTHGYVNQKEWRQLWARSLRVGYDPQVDIKVVKPTKQKSAEISSSDDDTQQNHVKPFDNGLMIAVRYTLKYSTKPDKLLFPTHGTAEDMEEDQKWLLGITQQLHKRRSVSLGGIFKKYMSEDDPTNLIVDEGNVDETETEDEDPRVTYYWEDEVTHYLIKA